MKTKLNRRRISFLLVLSGLVVSFPGFARDFTYEYLSYTVISEEEKTCKVASVSGEIPADGVVAIPSEVSDGTVAYTVTEVGERAFENCYELTEIIISESVITIGTGVFESCSNLKNVALPNSITCIGSFVFNGCYGLESIKIPDSVISISSYAFSNCVGLKSIRIPASVSSIGDNAFENCTSLTSIDVDANNESYVSDNGVLYDKQMSKIIQYPGGRNGSFSIPSTVTKIGPGTFWGCAGLTSIEIPDSVIEIGSHAFGGCTSLLDVVIPNSVTTIGEQAFSQCINLLDIVIPNSVTTIVEQAFYGCTKLRNVVIPNSVVIIGQEAFCACASLLNVVIPNSVVSIGDGAFSECSSLRTAAVGCPVSPFDGNNDSLTMLAIIYEDDVWQTLQPGNSIERIYVPKALVGAYKEKFPEYAAIIRAVPDYKNAVSFSEGTFGVPVSTNQNLTLDLNVEEAVGVQFDLSLPTGLSVAMNGGNLDISDAASRILDSHSISSAKLDNGKYRVIVYSSSNEPFAGNAGAFLNINLANDETFSGGDIEVSDIVITTVYEDVRQDAFAIATEKYIPVTDLAVNQTDQTAFIGDVLQFEAIVNPGNADRVNLVWTSSDEYVASVNAGGFVIALNEGTAAITCTETNSGLSVSVTITVVPVSYGDANADNVVDIADVVAIVEHILEKNPEPFNERFADVNCDGYIDVSDIKHTVSIIMAQSVSSVSENAAMLPQSFAEMQAKNIDERSIAFSITGEENLTALQADIELPEGLEIESASFISADGDTHAARVSRVEGNSNRLILYSMGLSTLKQGDLVLTFSGRSENPSKEMLIKNIIGSDTNARKMKIYDVSAQIGVSGIDFAVSGDSPIDVFSVDGKLLMEDASSEMLDDLDPGIYIIRQGSETKKIQIR